MIDDDLLSSIYIYTGRALLQFVTPNLRAVIVKVEEDLLLHLYLYYDHPLSEEEEEFASLTDTEFISAFPRPECHTDCSVIVLPYPKKIPKDGYLIYLRYEKPE